MSHIYVRCYAELNDFLPTQQQYTAFSFPLVSETTVGKLAKSIGVPFDAIDLVLVNGNSVRMDYQLKNNDRISFYPVFESFDISSVTELRDHPLRQPKFVLDVHLGKLASHLRMFGFDTLYNNNYTKELLLFISIDKSRILLSKDKSLIEDKTLTHAYLVKNIDSRLQLIEVFDRFDLYNLAEPFIRCIECNSLLRDVEKKAVFDRIPTLVKEWCDEYLLCPSCDRIYWKGSHYQHMNTFVQDILKRKSYFDDADKKY